MTTPTGLLAWGQAGTYDAVDDRAVITALANTHQGLVAPVKLTAGAGLTVSIAPGWLGVADCGDGTLAVVGSRATLAVTVPAGPATGSATYYLWCDVNPDAAVWTINVITPAAAVGRSGIQLGTVTAPAGSTLASQMTLTSATIGFGDFEGIVIDTGQTGGKAYLYALSSGQVYVQSQKPSTAGGTIVTQVQFGGHYSAGNQPDKVTLTPKYAIPAGDITPNTHYYIFAHGTAITPSPAQGLWFDVNGLGGFTRVSFTTASMGPGAHIYWQCEAHVSIDTQALTASIALKATMQNNGMPTNGAIVGLAYNYAVSINSAAASSLAIRSSIAAPGAPAAADCWGSIFKRSGGADPTSQIVP